MDWDQFTFWNTVPRDAILRYRQFPLWNPYVNGGNVLLAHPHSPFLSPLYFFVLLFGPIIGLKLEIVAHLVIGLCGMYVLSRYLAMNKKSACLSSFIYMLNSMYALHLTEGHTSWMTLAFVPWVFLYYLKSLKETKRVIGAVLFLSLILLAGSVDVFNILIAFLIIYTFLKAVERKDLIPVKVLVLILTGTFLLCAVKLFPLLEFLREYPRVTGDFRGAGFTVLVKMLLGREQAALDRLSETQIERMGFDNEWHEYGAYVGIVPLALFLIGAIAGFKKYWPLIVTGFLFLFISMAEKFPLNLWGILHGFPVYKSLSCPTRFMVGFVFTVSVLAGQGLSFVDERTRLKSSGERASRRRPFSVLIVLFVLFDLLYVNGPIFDNAFRIPPIKIKREENFRQRYRTVNFLEWDENGEKISRSSQYPIVLSNSGVLNAYEVINIEKGDVRIKSDPDYRGEVYLFEGRGRAEIEYFSPNKIVVDADVDGPDILVVNQNYYKGWKVIQGAKRAQAISFSGLIAAPVLSGHAKVVFYFLPMSFLLGLCVSLVFIVLAAGALLSKSKINIKFPKMFKMRKRNMFRLYSGLVLFGVVLLAHAMLKRPQDDTPEGSVKHYREFLKRNGVHRPSLLKETLYKQLEHDDYIVRMNVAEVIGELGDPGIVEDLWRITRDDQTPIVREAAVEGMCLSGDRSSMKYLSTLLRDDDAHIRRKAAECFDRLGDATARVDLGRAFNEEEDELTKIMIAMAMAHFGDAIKGNFILDVLTGHENRDFRIYVAESLFDHPMAVDEQMLWAAFTREPDEVVKVKIASLLARMGDQESLRFLRAALSRSEDVEIRVAAAWGLIEQTGPDHGGFIYPYILGFLNEEDYLIRESAVEMLDDYRVYELTPLLGKILETDKHPVVREIAAWLMGERKNKEALTYLEKGLYDENADVRTGVLAAIYKIVKANMNE